MGDFDVDDREECDMEVDDVEVVPITLRSSGRF